MLQTHIKTLLPYLELFHDAKHEVLHAWVDQPFIDAILKRHDVDTKYFIDYYASGVFDYFLSVIKGETALGTCPVMEEFLAYLKNKNFHADELFPLPQDIPVGRKLRSSAAFFHQADVEDSSSKGEVSCH